MSLQELIDYCNQWGVTMKSCSAGLYFSRQYTMSRRTYSNNRIVDANAPLETIKAAIREVGSKSDDELRFGDKWND